MQEVCCPPAMSYHVVSHPAEQQGQGQGQVKYLLRGDSQGRIHLWSIPSITPNQLAQLKQDMFDKPPSKLSDLSVLFQPDTALTVLVIATNLIKILCGT